MGSPQHSPRTGTGDCHSSAPNMTRGQPSRDTWRPPDLAPPGQRRTERPGPCAPRLPSTMGVPAKTGPVRAHTMPTPLRTSRVRDPQNPLTGHSVGRAGRTTQRERERVNELRLPRRNDGFPCTPLHYSSGCDRAAPPDRGRAPLNGRAVLRAEATQGRTRGSATDGGAGTDGQDRRRPPSDRPSGHATPTD